MNWSDRENSSRCKAHQQTTWDHNLSISSPMAFVMRFTHNDLNGRPSVNDLSTPNMTLGTVHTVIQIELSPKWEAAEAISTR